MPNRLFVDELVSVGMVKAGDNPDAEVVIYKMKTDNPPAETVESQEEFNTAGSGPRIEKVNMDLSAIEDDVLRKAVEDRIAELEAQIPDVEPSPVEKAEPEVQEYIAKLQEAQEGLQKQLDDERDARRLSDYIEKAKAYTVLFGKAEEVGPLLADFADKAPDSYTKFEPIMEALAQRVEMNDLFKELGSGESEGESDPLSKQAAWVAKNRQEGESILQAKARFWAEHPEEKKASREG